VFRKESIGVEASYGASSGKNGCDFLIGQE
jgi:hypothetical protein